MDTSIVSMLADNSDTVMNDAKDILIKLLSNVLKEPNNTKYRAVKLTNKTIEEKLIPASGAFEILFSVGFEEADDKLILPLGADMRIIQIFKQAITSVSKSEGKAAANE